MAELNLHILIIMILPRTYPVPSDCEIPRTIPRAAQQRGRAAQQRGRAAKQRDRAAKRRGNLEISYELLLPP